MAHKKMLKRKNYLKPTNNYSNNNNVNWFRRIKHNYLAENSTNEEEHQEEVENDN